MGRLIFAPMAAANAGLATWQLSVGDSKPAAVSIALAVFCAVMAASRR